MSDKTGPDQAEPNVRVELNRGIAVVRFDRPPVNAFDQSMYDQVRRGDKAAGRCPAACDGTGGRDRIEEPEGDPLRQA